MISPRVDDDIRETPIDRLQLEVNKLWELFVKVRGAVSCKLVETIVTAASTANNSIQTAATLPPVAADMDRSAFSEYVLKWLHKNESNKYNSADVMLAAFRLARMQYGTQSRWEFESGKRRFVGFDDPATAELERRYAAGAEGCLFDSGAEVFEVDFDSMMMYGVSQSCRLRRRSIVVPASQQDPVATVTHRFEKELPCANTAASWAYRPEDDEAGWQFFNRYQAFALERAFRENHEESSFKLRIGEYDHVIVTIDSIEKETGRTRGPYIRRACDPEDTRRYALIRRCLVPRENSHNSDVLWRRECPCLYAALALQERRPPFARVFREYERRGEMSLVMESLDDDDDTIYSMARELIDRWGIPPASILMPGEMNHYEVLINGTWVPMLPINNWLMQPTTILKTAKTSGPNTGSFGARRSRKNRPPEDEPYAADRVVFLFKQWLPYDAMTCTIKLPSTSVLLEPGSPEKGRQPIFQGASAAMTAAATNNVAQQQQDQILWCRLVEEKDAIVRFLLARNAPWICGKEVLVQHSSFPRKFLEANIFIVAPHISTEDATSAMMWALQGFQPHPLLDPAGDEAGAASAPDEAKKQRKRLGMRAAVEFFGFEKQLATLMKQY